MALPFFVEADRRLPGEAVDPLARVPGWPTTRAVEHLPRLRASALFTSRLICQLLEAILHTLAGAQPLLLGHMRPPIPHLHAVRHGRPIISLLRCRRGTGRRTCRCRNLREHTLSAGDEQERGDDEQAHDCRPFFAACSWHPLEACGCGVPFYEHENPRSMQAANPAGAKP
jgi:hypothetical protein